MLREQQHQAIPAPPSSPGSVRRISSAPALSLWEEEARSSSRAAGLTQLPQAQQATLPSTAIGAANASAGIEVFIANRSFTTWGGGIMNKLPPGLRDALRDGGLSHFLVICKQEGKLHLFDFGPIGGEITLNATAQDSNTGSVNQPKVGAPGEIREQVIPELPPGAMYVGRSLHWGLEDIRRHNLQQPTVYKLHENDCRHYVNNLVKQVTGLEHATVQLLQHSYAQRVRSEKEQWLQSILGVHPSTTSTTTTDNLGATATGADTSRVISQGLPRSVSSPVLCQSQKALDDLTSRSSTSSQAMLPAAPLLLPLLANLPTWDTPLVVLGQWMTHPANWPMVQGMGHMAMMSVGTMMGLKAAGLAHAAAAHAAAHVHLTTGNAASVATAAMVTGVHAQMAGATGAWKAAVSAIPRLVQQLRLPRPLPSALPPLAIPAAGVATHAATATGRLTSFAPAAKAIALQLKSRAAQVAAPLVAIAHSRQRQVQTTAHSQHLSASTTLSDVGASHLNSPTRQAPSLSAVLKGGLLPLPLRRPHHPPPAPTTTSTSSGFLSSSGLALPAALLTNSTTPTTTSPATTTTTTSPPRRSLWPLARRAPRSPTPTAQPARLPAATLQAAMLPEGPSTSLVTPRPRLVSLLHRTAHAKPLVTLSWVGAYHTPGLFKLANFCPSVWLGSRKQPQASSALMVIPAAPTAAPMAKLWLWNKPAAALPPPAPTPLPFTTNDHHHHHHHHQQLDASPACIFQQAQPLELTVSSSPASNRSWLGFGKLRQRSRAADISTKATLPSIPETDSTTDTTATTTASALCHMPCLPEPPAVAPKRRFLFKRSKDAAAAAGVGVQQQGTPTKRQWALLGQSSTSFASLVALVVTHMAQMQASKLLV